MRLRPSLFALTVGIATLAPLAATSPAAAVRGGLPTLWIYPSQDCPGSLQNCVDGAGPGDTVEVRSSDALGDISFSKSLTLRAGSGNHPVIGNLNISDSGSPSAVDIAVEGLTVTDQVLAFIHSHSGGSLTFQGMHLQELAPSAEPALHLQLIVATTISIEGNSFETAQGSGAVFVDVQTLASELVSAQIVGNTVKGRGGSSNSGGIQVRNLGDGSLDATIDGNSIWDAAEWGIVATASAGHTIVDLVGNTVDRTGHELLVDASALPAGAHMTINAFDDAFTNGGFPVEVRDSTPSRLTFRAGSNELFGNKHPPLPGGHSLGTRNLKVNPRYLDEDVGNLRLKPSSALIDQGVTCSPGGVVNVDAAGHGRLAGASVDIGAFERGAAAPTGVALVGGPSEDDLTGTAGADILCGMGGGDVLRGAGGADFLDGGAGGSDFIVGGSGPDRLRGGTGNDCIDARDGRGTDIVDGGGGTDHARTDPGDSLVRVEIRGPCPP